MVENAKISFSVMVEETGKYFKFVLKQADLEKLRVSKIKKSLVQFSGIPSVGTCMALSFHVLR